MNQWTMLNQQTRSNLIFKTPISPKEMTEKENTANQKPKKNNHLH